LSLPTSSHAYGIGIMAIIIGASIGVVYYTSFYLPESLAKPNVSKAILEPEGNLIIKIVDGAVTQGNQNFVPNGAVATLTKDNHVIWENDDSVAHTVTPDKDYEDSYSGEFGSPGVILPGKTYEFTFTQDAEIKYHCTPHPWMTGSITVEENKF
jgi:plastocyanin